MSAKLQWTSPAAAMDMVYDDPMGSMEGFSYALLRKRAKGKANTAATLARAKLQPREPKSLVTAGKWTVTAASHTLVLAPRVADEWNDVETLFGRYDECVTDRQKLLAAVITLRFANDSMGHDMVAAASSFAVERLANARRLSSLLALHLPGAELSARGPHVHLVVLSRAHYPSGFGAECVDLLREDAQELLSKEWSAFKARWEASILP